MILLYKHNFLKKYMVLYKFTVICENILKFSFLDKSCSCAVILCKNLHCRHRKLFFLTSHLDIKFFHFKKIIKDFVKHILKQKYHEFL